MRNIILFGAPGAGKGTQSAIIREKFDFAYISTGEILRAEIKAGTELGKQAEDLINKGELVSDEIIIGMIKSFIENNTTKDLLLDGFPRTVKQAEALDEILTSMQRGKAKVVELEVDKDVLMKRLLKRAEIEGRKDDNEETIRERFNQYDKKTAAVADYYKKKGDYIAIDGEHGTPQEISVKLIDILEKL
ncbi:MAG: adenylate kinase [Bacteroidales bacterium]|nr:adenylate kinase [Bacteroidales bacterium]